MAAISKRTQVLLWILAAGAAIALLAATVIGGRPTASSQHATYLTGSPEKGAALFYGKKHCSICHAVNGSGGRVAPDLGATHPGTPAMGWLITVIWNHMPGMWRQMHGEKLQLNQEEMAHILAFLYQAGSGGQAGRSRGRPEGLRCQRLRALPRGALQRRHVRPRPCEGRGGRRSPGLDARHVEPRAVHDRAGHEGTRRLAAVHRRRR